MDFCFACGEPINTGNNRDPSSSDDDKLFHCSNLQGVILGIGLAMLEHTFSEQRQQTSEESSQKSKTNKRRKTDLHSSSSTPKGDDDEDDSYYMSLPVGKKSKGGVGYAGDVKEDVSFHVNVISNCFLRKCKTSGQVEAQVIQRLKDEKIGTILSQIREYLPSLRREGGARTSDYMVHPTALAHLRRRFNYLCTTLLRNDSLSDMSDRSVLYFELFEWLEVAHYFIVLSTALIDVLLQTISNHEALASMMAMPIMVVSSVKSVAPKKVARGKAPIRERTIIYEGSAGPRELLEAIVIQAQAAIKGLEGIKTPDPEVLEMTEEQKRMTSSAKGKERELTPSLSDENHRLLLFCQRILATASAIDRSLRETKGDAFVDRLHAALPKISSEPFDHSSITLATTDEARKKAYVDWATQVRFEYCDLTVPREEDKKGAIEESLPHYKFYYNSEARMLATSDIPKRSLAIAKEVLWGFFRQGFLT